MSFVRDISSKILLTFVLTFDPNLNFALQCDMFSFDLYGCHRLPPQMSLRYFKFNLETYNGKNGKRCDIFCRVHVHTVQTFHRILIYVVCFFS